MQDETRNEDDCEARLERSKTVCSQIGEMFEKPQNLNELLIKEFTTFGCEWVRIRFQQGTIKEKGMNGVQFTFLIELAVLFLEKFNKDHPCKENEATIEYLQKALQEQKNRTKDREERGVEGESKD